MVAPRTRKGFRNWGSQPPVSGLSDTQAFSVRWDGGTEGPISLRGPTQGRPPQTSALAADERGYRSALEIVSPLPKLAPEVSAQTQDVLPGSCGAHR